MCLTVVSEMGPRALVADDDVMVLELTASMLQELGWDVLQARSRSGALGKIAEDQGIEILIADISLQSTASRSWRPHTRAFWSTPRKRTAGNEADGAPGAESNRLLCVWSAYSF